MASTFGRTCEKIDEVCLATTCTSRPMVRPASVMPAITASAEASPVHTKPSGGAFSPSRRITASRISSGVLSSVAPERISQSTPASLTAARKPSLRWWPNENRMGGRMIVTLWQPLALSRITAWWVKAVLS